MEVIIVERPQDAATIVADACSRLLEADPSAVLGLATGSTPLPVYAELVRRHREEGLSFARARAFLLDEYVGLAADHPERYRAVIERDLTGQIHIDPTAVVGPDGLADDWPPPAPPTTTRSSAPGASTCRSSASASTATSRSTCR